MRKIFYLVSIIFIFGLAYGGQLCRSGHFVVDVESGACVNLMNSAARSFLSRDTVELLENTGFETGSLLPWESTVWVVTDLDFHTGQYCAADVGNYWIRQNITPILTDSILSITFWSRQPEETIQAFDFIYDDSTYDEDIVWNQATWQQHDVTSYLPGGKIMVAVRFWGYSGGGPLPDSTYMDDVSVLAETEGQLVKENRAVVQQVDFDIHPNPVRDKAVITCSSALNDGAALSIYDISGMLVEHTAMPGNVYVWHTYGLRAGVYFVRVQHPAGQELMRKVLVIR